MPLKRSAATEISANTWRLQVVSTCLLALFCLFSFGTAKLRARIHQERRQALVSTDSGERLAHAAPVVALPVPLAGGATPQAEEGLVPVGWLQPARTPRPQPALSSAPRPLRGPPQRH